MGRIWLVRHAQTHYNKAQHEWEKTGVSMHNAPFRWDESLCDSPLTEEGIQQSAEASQVAHTLDVQKVFVSPFRRALQTCDILFKNHPNSPEIIVHPVLSECLHNGHDVSVYEGNPFPEYSHFNWSLVPNTHHIALEVCKNQHTLPLQSCSFSEARQHILHTMKELNPEYIESIHELYERAQHSKLAWKKELEHCSIALVTHSTFIKYFTAKHQAHGYSDYWWLENCEIREYHF